MTRLDIAGKIILQRLETVVAILRDSRKALNILDQLSLRIRTPYLRNLICQKLSDLEKKKGGIGYL